MKILFVSQYFYPENFKGNDIVFDFVKRGFEVTVLTAKPNYPQGKFYKGYNFFNKRQEIINGAKVIRTPIFPRGNGRSLSLALNYISFIFFSYFTCLFRIKERFDLIFIQQLSPASMALPGLWIKKKQQIPLFLWVLDLWPESLISSSKFKGGPLIRLIESMVKKIYNESSTILISSRFFKEPILEKCADKSKNIIYFPNWAEDVFTNNILANVAVPELPKGFNVMFAGNIGESQDFESILKVAELTSDINWILVGDGRKSDWIRNEIKNKKLSNIYLLGRYPIESMPLLFRKADVMLVSLKDEPIFALTVPAKVQAYMASGKIILGMLNGEGKDLINESKCGIAVSAGNYLSLAEAIIKMTKLPLEESETMKNNGLIYYNKHFSKKTLFDKLEVLFLNSINLNK